MIDDEATLWASHHVIVKAGELNKRAQPLGYGVTFDAEATLGADNPAHHQFRVHHIDQFPGSGTTFDTADEVRGYLGRVAKLPRWRTR